MKTKTFSGQRAAHPLHRPPLWGVAHLFPQPAPSVPSAPRFDPDRTKVTNPAQMEKKWPYSIYHA